jgi:hypothetical protein
MSADDILYEPIVKRTSTTIIDQVTRALSGSDDFIFTVDPVIDLAIYDQIADIVEQNPTVIAYTRKLVGHDPHATWRPAGAMTMKTVFHRLHAGIDEFWFCGRCNGAGIQHYHFTNWFAITKTVPMVQIDTKTVTLSDKFELWVLGLLGNFVGYSTYYAFATKDEARKYYAIP